MTSGKIILLVFVILLVIWTLGSFLVVRNIEEPSYTVMEKKDGYEIRKYDPYIIAEVEVTAPYREALNEGFRLIADYIFGNNTSKASIAMTAPVLDEAEISEKIAMTAPVLDAESENNLHKISFVMPSEYTIETLPMPNNDAVEIREIPARKIAVLQFSWYATASRVAQKKEQLATALQRDDISFTGVATIAQYNPPLTVPFLRRNEVWVEVE